MIRGSSLLLCFWLALLFVVGPTSYLPAWYVWLVGGGAAGALLVGFVAPLVGERVRIGLGLALGIGVLALSVVGLMLRLRAGLPWCLLCAALAYLAAVAATATGENKRSVTRFLAQQRW